jgi:AcrR family transcriptional regulator
MVTRRAPLTRDRVIEAALQLADESGIDALSMRKLGAALGVEAMSLYNHVANKRDLLSGLVTRVASEMEPPDADGDWAAAVRASAVSAHAALRRHPWAASLMLSPDYVSDVRMQHMDALLARLRIAGFSDETVYHAYHAIEGHIFGFSLWAAGHNIKKEDLPALATAFVAEHPIDDYPDILTHFRMHMDDGPHQNQGAFEFALDLLLEGLERLRRQAGSAETPPAGQGRR